MKHTLTLLTVLLLTALSAVHAASHSKPNILVILADDLGETKNLAAAMPEKIAEMKALLEKLITDGRSTPGAQQKNDFNVVRELKALLESSKAEGRSASNASLP